MSDIQTWTLVFVVVTFAIYIAIAYMSRVSSTAGFYVAGGGIPAPANGAAIAADWMSAASFISMAGIIAFAGYSASAYLMGWTGGYVLLAMLLAPYLCKFGKFTVPEFIGDRFYSGTARIVAVVREAREQKAQSQDFTDRVIGQYYAYAVVGITLLALALPLLFLGWDLPTTLYRAMTLMVVASPCALVISIPVTYVAAMGRASRDGVLIKGGIYLEELGRLRAIALDKTGTLTHGRPELTEIHQEGSGSITVEALAVAHADVSSTGSGSVHLAGTIGDVAFVSTGSGGIHARELQAETAQARSTGSGGVELHASELVDAELTGSGDIHVWGSPDDRHTRVTGSGRVVFH